MHPEAEMNLRVMTYNIQSGWKYRSEPKVIDLPAIAETVKRYSPDVLVLNEVRGRGVTDTRYTDSEAETIASLLGYYCYFGRSIYVSGTDPYGNAVLSRYPITEAKVFRIPDAFDKTSDWFEPRTVTRAVIELPDGDSRRFFTVFASHFGLSRGELEMASAFSASLLRDEPNPFVMMGDFNAEPSDEVLTPLYAHSQSLTDLFGGQKSFPSDLPEMRIDYILPSKGITTASAVVPDERESDHRPAYADLII